MDLLRRGSIIDESAPRLVRMAHLATVEIREQVGAENVFLFGHSTEQIAELLRNYRPREWVERVSLLHEALELIEHGHFSDGDTELFRPLVPNIVGSDPRFPTPPAAATSPPTGPSASTPSGCGGVQPLPAAHAMTDPWQR